MKEKQAFKRRIYDIIEKDSKGDFLSIGFDYFILSLIVLNVLAIIFESYQNIEINYKANLYTFELFSVIIFSIEYVLRIWTSEFKFKSQNRFHSLIKYIFSPLALIDLLAVLPFYLPMIIPFDLRFLRILRLTRMLRIFKLNRYSKALKLISKVLKDKKEELLITVFVTLILILFASTIMFYIEHDVQPEKYPNIVSSFWWGISTLTTVGYGDVYPLTGWGRLLSGLIAALGIGLVALPTGIISSGFMKELNSRSDKKSEDICAYCPYCGEKIRK